MQMCPLFSHDNRDSARFCAKCQTQLLGLLGANTLLQGRYRVLKVLGCGGIGAVYLAEETHLAGKQVAIKENLDISLGALEARTPGAERIQLCRRFGCRRQQDVG